MVGTLVYILRHDAAKESSLPFSFQHASEKYATQQKQWQLPAPPNARDKVEGHLSFDMRKLQDQESQVRRKDARMQHMYGTRQIMSLRQGTSNVSSHGYGEPD